MAPFFWWNWTAGFGPFFHLPGFHEGTASSLVSLDPGSQEPSRPELELPRDSASGERAGAESESLGASGWFCFPQVLPGYLFNVDRFFSSTPLLFLLNWGCAPPKVVFPAKPRGTY